MLDGATGSWYYNDFFADHPSVAIYQRYYRTSWAAGSSFSTVQLPANQTPELPARRIPSRSTDGANNILLTLDRVEYSSRYGGTVRLRFQMADYATEHNLVNGENFDYEFRHGDYLFDLTELEMSVFSYPLPKSFNPTAIGAFEFLPNAYNGTYQAEFSYRDAASYRIQNNVVTRVPFDDAARGHLDTVMREVEVAAAGVGYFSIPNSQRFALGFLHDQFQSLFQALGDATDGAEKIWLSDNFADLTTRQRTAVFMLDFRMEDIGAVDDDTEMRGTVWHVYESAPEPIPFFPTRYAAGASYLIPDIGPGDHTPWLQMGMWNLSECDNLGDARMIVTLKDRGVIWDDNLGPVEYHYDFDCAELRRREQNGEWGLVEEIVQGSFYADPDPPDPPGGGYFSPVVMATARARVWLTTR